MKVFNKSNNIRYKLFDHIRKLHVNAQPRPNKSYLKPSIFVGSVLTTSLLYNYYKQPISLERKEEVKDIQEINSLVGQVQLDQIQNSAKYPGVFLWGSNEFGLASPGESNQVIIKQPKKLDFFEGSALRAIEFGTDYAVAIDSQGDIYQWGRGYFGNSKENVFGAPEISLKGKDIVKVSTSEDKILALSKSGRLYMFPASKEKQLSLLKNKSNGWYETVLGSNANFTPTEISLPNSSWNEKVIDFSTGLHHLVLLSNKNRVLSMALDENGTKYGQLGTQDIDKSDTINKVEFDVNKLHNVKIADNITLEKVCCGANHSIVKSTDGRVFVFGLNSFGQLGLGSLKASNTLSPLPLEITASLAPPSYTNQTKVMDIYAGGDMSAFSVKNIDKSGIESITLYTAGYGQWGQLGNGKFVQAEGSPTKVIAVSNKFEYSEKLNKMQPIGIYKLSISNTHVFATLKNEPNQQHGNEVNTWGQNKDFQCNTGKRSSIATPIPPNLPIYPHQLEQLGLTDINEISEFAYQARMQMATPMKVQIKLSNGKIANKTVEQEIVAGPSVSALYSKVVD